VKCSGDKKPFFQKESFTEKKEKKGGVGVLRKTGFCLR
jgi:hypothetical protein